MPIAYSWKFPQLIVEGDLDGLQDVVIIVSWERTATEAKYQAQAYGQVRLSQPDPSSFTPFEELSESQIEQWVISSLGDQLLVYDAELAEQILNQKTPPVKILPPPWETSNGGSIDS